MLQVVEPAAKSHRPVPAMIGTGFGGLWAVIGALALPRSWTPWAIAAAVAITLVLTRRLWLSAAAESSRLFRRSAYRVAVIAEVVAIAAASYILPRYRLEAYFVPAVGIIVGLHFLGLWRASGKTVFLCIAGTMCTISAAAVALPAAPFGSLNPRVLFTGYANALVLWVGASRRK